MKPNITSRRNGSALIVGLFSIIIVVGLILVAMKISSDPQPLGNAANADILEIHCAAGVYAPVQAIADAYEEEFGVRAQIVKGGSSTLLSSLEITKRGDIYIAGDDHFIDLAKDKGLLAETMPITIMEMVVAVPAGNPKNINTIDDLVRDDVNLYRLAGRDGGGQSHPGGLAASGHLGESARSRTTLLLNGDGSGILFEYRNRGCCHRMEHDGDPNQCPKEIL